MPKSPFEGIELEEYINGVDAFAPLTSRVDHDEEAIEENESPRRLRLAGEKSREKRERSKRRPEPSLKARAVQYLSRREYSRTELRAKLFGYLKEDESEADLEALLSDLEARGYLSDERYAKSRARIRSQKYGNARVAFELKRHGLSSEVVTQAIEEIKDSEFDRAKALWLKKFRGVKPTDYKEKTRHIRYLAARGFSFDVVQKVLDCDLDDAGGISLF